MTSISQKIVPCLWFDSEAEEAAKFYASIFDNSEVLNLSYYTEAGTDIHKQPAGKVMTVEFTLAGQKFVALNGGPIFKFNEAVSFIVNCDNQEEIDDIWEKLSAIPDSEQCGWLKDRFGVSWQIVPSRLDEMLRDSDTEAVKRVTEAFLKMKKLDIAALEQAFKGPTPAP